MTYTVISIFFILLLAYLVLRAVYGFIRRDRKERIVFLREFKKGKCVAVYLIAIPLFFIGYDYVQESGTYAVFETISRTFNSVVNMIALKFEFMSVETLMKDNHFYGSAESEEKIVKAADRSWFAEWPQAKRDSNLYASLSVRSKLLMMGLDFEKKKGGKSYLSYDEYMKLYAGDDLPEITGGAMKNGRGSAIRFSTNFKPSRAYNMAYQEHQRWNAYMMSRGIVPADKETILNETDDSGRHTNGNSYERRHHGNLTNFDGLREFAKMIAKRDNISEEKADVILYDYQLLDDAWWILDEMGYGIYEIA